MKLRDRKLERNLREAVQCEVRQSPELWRQYSIRLWQSRLDAALVAAVMSVVVIGTPVVVTIVSIPLLGFGEEQAAAGRTNDPDITLGLYSLVALGVLAIIAGGNDRAYVSLRGKSTSHQGVSIRSPAFLPFRDQEFRSMPRRLIAASLTVVCLFFAAPYVLLAWRMAIDFSTCLAAAGLFVVHLLVLFAAYLVVLAYSPVRKLVRECFILSGLFLCLVCPFIGLKGLSLPQPLSAMVRGALYVSPTGWVNAVFLEGLVGGATLAWLLLIPAAIVILSAVPLFWEWLRSEFHLREFAVTPHGWYGVIERGFRVPAKPPEPLPLFGPLTKRPWTIHLLPSDIEPSFSVRLRDCIGDPTWRSCELIEKLRDGWLTQRERTVLRVWSGSYERLTAQWAGLLCALVVCVGLALLIRAAPAKQRDVPLWGMPFVALAFSRLCIRAGPEFGEAHVFRWFPVSFREACRAAWKQAIVRAACALPLMLGYGAIVAAIVDLPLLVGGLYALVPLIVMLAMEPVIYTEKLGLSLDDLIAIITLLVLHCCVFVAAGLVAASFISPYFPLRIVALGLLFPVNGGLWWCYDRMYRLGKFDLASSQSRRRG